MDHFFEQSPHAIPQMDPYAPFIQNVESQWNLTLLKDRLAAIVYIELDMRQHRLQLGAVKGAEKFQAPGGLRQITEIRFGDGQAFHNRIVSFFCVLWNGGYFIFWM